MKYEILVATNREQKNRNGKIFHIQPKETAEWGRLEAPPKFKIISIDIEIDKYERKALIKEGFYDLDNSSLVFKEDGSPFKKTELYRREEFEAQAEIATDEEAIREMKPDIIMPEDTCIFLNSFEIIGDELKQRTVLIRSFFSLRKEQGMRRLMLAVKHGLYGELYKALKSLPSSTKIKVKNALPSEFLEVFKKYWGILK